MLGKDDKPPPKALMNAMPYTQSLLANGMAIGYHAKAAPPTVTMPRLKVGVLVQSFKICVTLSSVLLILTIWCVNCRLWFLVQLGDSWMWLSILTHKLY